MSEGGVHLCLREEYTCLREGYISFIHFILVFNRRDSSLECFNREPIRHALW